MTKPLWTQGLIIGVFMYLGMILQTLGLQFTTASRSGFITGLCVIFVPLLVIFIERRLPQKTVLFGVILATLGLYLLSNPRAGSWNRGDTLTLFSALAFAFQIIFISIFGKKSDPFGIAFMMLAMTSLFSLINGLFVETFVFHLTLQTLIIILYMALICTTFTFAIQVHWQPKTTSTAAAVIYTSEPVFAFIFAMLVLNERLSIFGWIGAGFILAGMVVTEIRKELAAAH